jgi:flagellar basal-body rod protein FlgG
MANGLQIAASGLLAQEWRLAAVANDVANVNTAGYTASRTAFSEVLGTQGGVRAGSAGSSSVGGTLAPSDNPLAVAIDGPGFIQVRAADGTVALSRDGNLHVGSDGKLALASGAVLDPPVTIPADVEAGTVSIARDGTVTAAGRKLGALTLVDVPAADELASRPDGLRTTTAASGAAQASEAVTVQQGFVEGSNVDLASALTELMDAQRAFQLSSRALHTQDQLLEIANGIRRS